MNPDVKEDLKNNENMDIGLTDISSSVKSEDIKKIVSNVIAKKRFLAGEQISQEENYLSEESPPSMNGCLCPSVNQETKSSCHKMCINQNNNLVVDKTNLQRPNEKSLSFYLKLPMKVNNNVYPGKSTASNDGMEDYFEQYSGVQKDINYDSAFACNGFNEKASTQLPSEEKEFNSGQLYPDQINALNGDEEDEDNGCIYTYKGDNYEDNLSHLLETCFSCGLPTTEQSIGSSQRGTITIQRLLNGSLHQNPKPQSNLYSPDMDFLEMDFDPGSAGDGEDSDIEDNNFLNDKSKLPEENILENFIKQDHNLDKKTSNITNEIRRLLCRRCELCISNEQKVNNLSSDLAQQKVNCNQPALQKLAPSPKLPLDDRPVLPNEINVGSDILSSDNPKQNISDDNISCDMMTQVDNCSANKPSLHQEDDKIANQENDLNGDDDEFSDDFDADDEGGDDSTSDQPPSLFLPSPTECHPTPINGSNKFNDDATTVLNKSNKHIKFSSETTDPSVRGCFSNGDNNMSDQATENTRDSNGSKSVNNNLGSISAPEISPTKEYSPIERIGRSLSFHNQLSSPKYENACFSHPYKDNLVCVKYHSSKDQCVCTNGHTSCKAFQHPQMANIEACVDRLSQRERSVFNIGTISQTKSFSAPDSSSIASKVTNSSLRDNNCESSSSVDDTNNTVNIALPQDVVDNIETFSLSIKLLQCKAHDSSQDPNTASETIDEDQSKEGLKTQKMEKVMIWTERQATLRQVPQVGTSACGATAVINALLALDEPKPVKDVILAIKTRLRAEESPLVDYLLSRSNAGTAHHDLLSGIQEISNVAVTGRFFHMFPKRAFQLARWLSHWIKKGGVPVATLNLQVGVSPGQTIPDAWHHQMVFGVGPLGIYLTNPLECVSDSLLSDQLCSDSVLLVRRGDLVNRWNKKDKLVQLSLQSDCRWNEMNVLGQVACVLKEQSTNEVVLGRRHLTSHVSIPASYQSGVTIFIRSDNVCKSELFEAKELPLLDE